MTQATSTVLMIRPVRFAYNEQTSESNAFQVAGASGNVQDQALAEFDAFVNKLRSKGVDVTVIDDTPEPHTPDSIFPNNWISFHNDGSVFLYPMQAENRRLERRNDIINLLSERFKIGNIYDLSHFESSNRFLEGTGSMVLDRENKICYSCLSPRTDENILNEFAAESGFKIVSFHSVDQKGKAIYHTNVMMCVGDQFVVICLDSIPDDYEREKVKASIISTRKEIVEISFDQMNHFAGNMLQVQNQEGKTILVMSQQAYQSLQQEQVTRLSRYSEPLFIDLSVIESNGGGSARCMIAEIHLPKK